MTTCVEICMGSYSKPTSGSVSVCCDRDAIQRQQSSTYVCCLGLALVPTAHHAWRNHHLCWVQGLSHYLEHMLFMVSKAGGMAGLH
jgi:hypothetical protein